MANPQLENGYLKLSTELCKGFASLNISGNDWLMLWVVIIKTYGWNKKEDKISLTQFQKMTGLSRPTVVRRIKRLVRYGVLGSCSGDTTHTSSYWVIKDYNKWKPSSRIDTSSRFATRPSNIPVKKLVAEQQHTKDSTQKTIKYNIPEQVKTLFDSFDKNFQNKIEVYIDRVCKKNKSGVITEGRKVTMLNELFTAKDRCNDDNLFGYAMDGAIGHDACNIGYINAIIKNKKTQKPSEGRAYHAIV